MKDRNIQFPKQIVALVASAGGLEALKKFFGCLPDNTGCAYVVIQHLSPDFESLMDTLLANHTRMSIQKLSGKDLIKPNTIYLNQPESSISLDGDYLTLTKSESKSPTLPIDSFYSSLAKQTKYESIAIILSGTGSDGSKGIADISKANGTIFVQSPDDAQFDGMPQSAINTGLADFVLSAENLALAVSNYVSGVENHSLNNSSSEITAENYTKIYKMLKTVSSNDYDHYKPSSIYRRINRRMQLLKISKLEDYAQLLKTDQQELTLLEKDLLIGVTEFMRDKPAFDLIKKIVIPEIISKHRDDNAEIRVWVVACSTGQEAYSLAILFLEYIEKKKLKLKVKVFATDLKDSFLKIAQKGIYIRELLSGLDRSVIKKYFTTQDDKDFKVSSQLRSCVTFSRHNAIDDMPFKHMDLVTCRNFLIYLKPEAQMQIIKNLIFAAKVDGYILLGPSETMFKNRQIETIDSMWNIYKKNEFLEGENNNYYLSSANKQNSVDSKLSKNTYKHLKKQKHKNALLIDLDFNILHVFPDTTKYLKTTEVNKKFDINDILIDNLEEQILKSLNQSKNGIGSVRYNNIACADKQINLIIQPILKDSKVSAVLLKFEPYTPEDNLTTKNQDLKDLKSELEQTKVALEDNDEKLIDTKEEVQELEEELRCSNEELQTSNEELQATNEELTTVNHEFQEKIVQLNHARNDINNILNSSQNGLLIVDNDLNIRLITPAINQVINIFDRDIGRNLKHFKHDLIIDDLYKMLRDVINGGKEINTELEDKHSNWFILRIFQYINSDGSVQGGVISVTNITSFKKATSTYNTAIKALLVGVIIVNENGKITFCNDFFSKLTGYDTNELVGHSVNRLIEQDKQSKHNSLYTNYLKNPTQIDMARDSKIRMVAKDGHTIPVVISLIPYTEKDNKQFVLCNILDMTKVEKAEKILEQSQRDLEKKVAEKSKQLKESEKKYSEFYNNSPDMHASVDPKTGLVLFCNQTFLTNLGYTKEEVIGKPIIGLYHYSSLDSVEKAFKKFKKTGVVENTEFNLRSANGLPYPVVLKVNAIRDENGNIVRSISSWRDLSDIKSLGKNAKNLKQDGVLYNTVLNSISDGWWDLHLDTNNLFMSSSFKSLFGYKDDELYNHLNTWEKLCFEDDFDKFQQLTDDILSGKKQNSFSIELRFRHKNNSTVWVLCRGIALKENDKFYRIIGTNLDISKSKNLEASLRDAKSFAELTLNASEDHFFVKDSDFKIVQANTSFLNLYPEEVRDKVIGYTTLEKYDQEEAEKFLTNDKTAFEKGISKVLETVMMPKGIRTTFETTKIRFHDNHHTPFILGIARDVTEKESLFEKLEETNTKLESSNSQLVTLNK